MPTTLYLPLGTAGLTGLTARTLDGGTLSAPATLSEVAGASGLYEGAIADSFEIALVFDEAGTLIAEAAYGGGFTPEDAAALAAARVAAEAALEHTRPMAKQLGLVAGVTANHSPDGIVVSDGDGSTAIADNLDGSYTVELAP